MPARRPAKTVSTKVTSSVHVTLDATQQRWVKKRVRDAGYASASEYVRALIRRDREDPVVPDLESRIAEGLRSSSTPWTLADSRALRTSILRRAAARRR